MVAAQQEVCRIEEFVSALAASPAPELGLIELQLQCARRITFRLADPT